MRITAIDKHPFHTLRYRNVAPGQGVAVEELPFLRATVDGMPPDIDAIIATADLQGRGLQDQEDGPPLLLGELLSGELEVLSERGDLPLLHRVGVLLGGDLFCRPGLDRRGGSGDVRLVWEALADRCRWVAGVGGNHDVFGPGWSILHLKAFKKQDRIAFLDDSEVMLDGLVIAGLSGTIGNPRRPFRRLEADFCACVKRLAAGGPDIFVMHDGPDVSGTELRGLPSVRETLECSRPTLVVRGHKQWSTPLATLANGTQVLNVDSRVVILAGKR